MLNMMTDLTMMMMSSFIVHDSINYNDQFAEGGGGGGGGGNREMVIITKAKKKIKKDTWCSVIQGTCGF